MDMMLLLMRNNISHKQKQILLILRKSPYKNNWTIFVINHPSSLCSFSLFSFISVPTVWREHGSAKWILDVFRLQLMCSILSVWRPWAPSLCVVFEPLLRAGVDNDLIALLTGCGGTLRLDIVAGCWQVHLLSWSTTRERWGLDWCGRGWLVSWALDIRGFWDIGEGSFNGNSTVCCEGGMVLDKAEEERKAVEGTGPFAWVSEYLLALLVDFPVCVALATVLLVLMWVELLFGWRVEKGPVVLCLCLVMATVSPLYSNRKSLWLFSGSSFSPQQDLLKISKVRSEMKGCHIYIKCYHTSFYQVLTNFHRFHTHALFKQTTRSLSNLEMHILYCYITFKTFVCTQLIYMWLFS